MNVQNHLNYFYRIWYYMNFIERDDPAYYFMGTKVGTDPSELCSRIFYTCYMGSMNSSKTTREAARLLAQDIASNHSRFHFRVFWILCKTYCLVARWLQLKNLFIFLIFLVDVMNFARRFDRGREHFFWFFEICESFCKFGLCPTPIPRSHPWFLIFFLIFNGVFYKFNLVFLGSPFLFNGFLAF